MDVIFETAPAETLEQYLVSEFKNIAKGTTDPGVDYFNQLLWFGLVKLV